MADELGSRKRKFEEVAATSDETTSGEEMAGSDEAGGSEEMAGSDEAGGSEEMAGSDEAGGSEETTGSDEMTSSDETRSSAETPRLSRESTSFSAESTSSEEWPGSGQVKRDIAVNIGEASGRAEASGNETWSTLPDVPLQTISSYLNRNDHYAMGMTCDSWKRLLQFPGVWETYAFVIRRKPSSLQIDDIHFAEKYGNLFRKLIIFSQDTVMEMDTRSKFERLNLFLRILAGRSQLFEIYILQLYASFRLVSDSETYNVTCEAIADFLGSQRRLKKLQINFCLFEYSDGIKILKRAIESNRDLDRLLLVDFLENRKFDSDDSADEQILTEILSLPHLNYIYCDYRLILGERANPSQVVESLTNHRSRLELNMHLIINADSLRYARLTSEQWNTLNTEIPNVRVRVKMIASNELQLQAETFIVADFPILDLRFNFIKECEDSVRHLLEFLATRNTNNYLEYLNFQFWEEIGDLDSIFTPFLKTCNKLKYFKFNLVYSQTELTNFLNSTRTDKTESLEKVKLFFTFLPNAAAAKKLDDVSLVYVPLLKFVNIALQIQYQSYRYLNL